MASILRSLAKRGRGIGLSFVTVLHHLSDLPADSDAMSLIREAGIVHVYAQSKADDVAAPPERRTASIRKRATKLGDQLTATNRFQAGPLAREMREAIDGFCAPPPALPAGPDSGSGIGERDDG